MRIPSAEGFGQVVAEPARPDRRRDVTPDSLGAGLAQSVRGIAMDAQQTLRREDIALQREQARLQDDADRANSVRMVQSARTTAEAARDEHAEGIRSGTIPKAEAANLWKERMNTIRSESLEGVPPKFAADALADFEAAAGRYDRDINKALTDRNQSEVRAGLNSTFETAQRLYMKDPAAANRMIDDAVASFGPSSGMSVEDLGKAKQAWSENTRFAKASEMIVAGRRDNNALTQVEKALNSEEFATMDPQRKVQLMTQVEGFKVANIQRAEAAANRVRAERDSRLREAEGAFNAASGLVMGGKTLSPEYVTQLSKTMAGTPFAEALPDLLRQAPEKSAFGMQPIAVMDATITQIRGELNKRGTDPATEKRVAGLEKIRDQARKDYAEDPLIAAQERGLVTDLQPVDTRDVRSLVGSLAARVTQANVVAEQVGQPVSPLLRQEAEQVGRTLAALPVEQRSTAIAQIAVAMGPQQAAALAKQMSPKDKALAISLGMAGERTTAGRYTSELVLRGAQAIKDKAVKEDNAALTGIRSRVAAEIGDAYPNQQLREQMIEAAVLAEYGLQSEGSGNPTKAVNLVTGGIVERAGRRIPLPRGMDESSFDKRLTTLTPENLRTALPDNQVHLGGLAMSTDSFLKHVPKAALIHAGSGRYAVQTQAGLATNSAGKPLIIEVH